MTHPTAPRPSEQRIDWGEIQETYLRRMVEVLTSINVSPTNVYQTALAMAAESGLWDDYKGLWGDYKDAQQENRRLAARVEKAGQFLLDVAEGWKRDRSLHGSPALRDLVDDAVRVFEMAAEALADTTAVHVHTRECYSNYNDPTKPYCTPATNDLGEGQA